MITRQNEKIALELRTGSFCIYVKETLECLSSGDVDSVAFDGNEEKMVNFADSKFTQLSKVHN